ncbi:MAG: hypothetical protein C5B59_10105 [Bacteroidetes bacterium]|nr:MAG: hypothetical protein C5B59_10105 [Bacteroidota bacterium]
MLRIIKTDTESFVVQVNGKPLTVVVTPCIVNNTNEKRFRVSYNGSPVHIFTCNENEKHVHAVKDKLFSMPLQEEAIAKEIENRMFA